MRAWRYTKPKSPLERHELPEPEPGPGEVVVKVRAAGLCHSDLHILDEDWPGATERTPLTMGHEGAGDVHSVGEGVTSVSVGDRVAVYGAWPCGTCVTCRSGKTSICPDRGQTGIGLDGSFADYVLAREVGVVRIPDGVSYEMAAVATDAVITPYHALITVGRIEPGEEVAVIGLGGLGLNGVQIAAARGARVIAVDPVESKRAAALERGAAEALPDLSPIQGRADMVVDFVGAETTLLAAQMAVRAGGRVVVVGLGPMMAQFIPIKLVVAETALLGSYWGTREELVECLDMIATGKVVPIVESHPLDTVNEQVDRLRAGQVLGRVVLVP